MANILRINSGATISGGNDPHFLGGNHGSSVDHWYVTANGQVKRFVRSDTSHVPIAQLVASSWA